METKKKSKTPSPSCVARCRDGLPPAVAARIPLRSPARIPPVATDRASRGGGDGSLAATTIANGRLRRPSRDHRRRRRRWEKWEEEADRGRKEWEEEADREGGVGVGAEREMGGESGCGAI